MQNANENTVVSPGASVDDLGAIMKKYEAVSDSTLMPNMPCIVRLDGDSFHKVVKLLDVKAPFDDRFSGVMTEVAFAVTKYLSGAICAFVQSDEISIIMRANSPHLAGRVNKINSICASLATNEFIRQYDTKRDVLQGRPLFDCRVFSIPHEDLATYLRWRQMDAWKNCVGQALFHALGANGEATAKMLRMGIKERQEAYFVQTGRNVHSLPLVYRRGGLVRQVLAIKPPNPENPRSSAARRRTWVMDSYLPIFGKNPAWVASLLAGDLPEAIGVEADTWDGKAHLVASLVTKGDAYSLVSSATDPTEWR